MDSRMDLGFGAHRLVLPIQDDAQSSLYGRFFVDRPFYR